MYGNINIMSVEPGIIHRQASAHEDGVTINGDHVRDHS